MEFKETEKDKQDQTGKESIRIRILHSFQNQFQASPHPQSSFKLV